MDVEPAQVEAVLLRIKPQVEAQDFELLARLWSTLVLVMRLVRAQRASIEEKNLIYVAVTRAKQHLIFVDSPEAPEEKS